MTCSVCLYPCLYGCQRSCYVYNGTVIYNSHVVKVLELMCVYLVVVRFGQLMRCHFRIVYEFIGWSFISYWCNFMCRELSQWMIG